MRFFAAFILALFISLFFLRPYKNRGALPVLLVFTILFLAGIAAQIWIVPFGPIVWGVSWFPLLFIILIFTFLFAIPSPYQPGIAKQSEETQENVTEAISIFTWLLLFLLLIALVLGYYYRSFF